MFNPSIPPFSETQPSRTFGCEDIQSVARQCLGALRFLHEDMRLTHTDLKLENAPQTWDQGGMEISGYGSWNNEYGTLIENI